MKDKYKNNSLHGKRKRHGNVDESMEDGRPTKVRLSRAEQKAAIFEKKQKTKLHFDDKKEAQKRLNTFFKQLDKLKKNEKDLKVRKQKQWEMIAAIFDHCVKGKTLDYAKNASGSRILQAILKNGSNDLRMKLWNELEKSLGDINDIKPPQQRKGGIHFGAADSWKTLASNQFGKWVLIAFYKAGGVFKEKVICFSQKYSHDLMQHVHSLTVLEHVWQNIGSSLLRLSLLQDFYGATGKIHKIIGTNQKDEMRQLETYKMNITEFALAHPDAKTFIVKNLLFIVKKAIRKGLLITNNIMHYLLIHTLQLAPPEEVKFILDDIMERIPSICHTSEGSHVGCLTVFFTRAKRRKALIKAFKPFVVPAATDKHTWRVLATLLDCTDDTILSTKHILKSLMEPSVFLSSYGRLCLLFIMDRNNPIFKNYPHFRYDHMENLREDIHEKDEDEASRRVSKKDPEIIHKDLKKQLVTKCKMLEFIETHLDHFIAQKDEHLQFTIYRLLHDSDYDGIESIQEDLKRVQEKFVALTHQNTSS